MTKTRSFKKVKLRFGQGDMAVGGRELEKVLEGEYQTYTKGMENLGFLSMKKTGLGSNSIQAPYENLFCGAVVGIHDVCMA